MLSFFYLLPISLESAGIISIFVGICVKVVYEADVGFILIAIGSLLIAVGSLIWSKILKARSQRNEVLISSLFRAFHPL